MRLDSFTQNLRNNLTAAWTPGGRHRRHRVKALLAIGFALTVLTIVPMAGLAARSTQFTKAGLNGNSIQLQHTLSNALRTAKLSLNISPNHGLNYRRPPAHDPSDIALNNWTSLYPQLFSVSAVSDSDAWAVGEYGHLAHYAGGSWSAIDPQNMQGSHLTDINMLSSNSGWIAAGYKAFQYDGTNWTERSTGLGSGIYLNRISALGPNNVWGVSSVLQCGLDCSATILHWDGSSWASQVAPGTVSPVDISMVSPNDGWVLNGDVPNLLHYDGTSWTPVSIPDPDAQLYGITTTPNGDVWIAAAVYNLNGSFYQGRIYRYSVGHWSAWDTPDYSVPYDIYMADPSHGWAATENGILGWDGSNWTVEYKGRYLTGVSGTGGQVWAVGAADTIMNRTGSNLWSLQRGGPTTADLYAASALDVDDVWAVGGSITSGGGPDKGTFNTAILHYTGAWELIPTSFTTTIFYNIKMLSPTEGYAVGRSGPGSVGVIAMWDGTTWTQVATPTESLRGLYMLGSGEGWAMGSEGAIWHDHNGVWRQVSSPVTNTLYTVSMDSPSHGWAAGGDCCTPDKQVLLEYVGSVPTGTITSWVDRTSLLPAGFPVLRDITLAPGGNEGWLVGQNAGSNPNVRPILHLSDGTWGTDPYSDTPYLYNVEPGEPGEYWAVGDCIHHYDGQAWQRVDCPSYYSLFGLAMTPGDTGWATGAHGEIMQYALPSPTPTATPTTVPLTFRDVHPTDYFYEAVRVLLARGVISGYSDNTFRPNDSTTRAQLCKIVVLANGWPIDSSSDPRFTDVPVGSTFYSFVQTAFDHNIIAGYSDGTFHPGDSVTRAQLSKIVVLAQGWQIDTGGRTQFRDVPPTHPLYGFIQTAYGHNIVSGYDCGTGCLEFRPNNDASRGQIAKIVYLAISSTP